MAEFWLFLTNTGLSTYFLPSFFFHHSNRNRQLKQIMHIFYCEFENFLNICFYPPCLSATWFSLCSSFFLPVEAGFNDRDAKRGEGGLEEVVCCVVWTDFLLHLNPMV